ncbi:MAG: putative toxin-antitoxin system toxin component, PIN family [Leptolyngbya sp. RL_3_1]|nr:putative toxin-antitoxin system toxin component, PIN family [Leptolyngbya sp. RL_3_1]
MSEKIVIDTSVFISALIGPSGPSRELLRLTLQGRFLPLFTTTLFCEYESVCQRQVILERCSLAQDEIKELTEALLSVSQWVTVYYTWRPNLTDEADNHLIELAVAGNAEIIVTNNIKDFKNAELLFPNLSIAKPENVIRR